MAITHIDPNVKYTVISKTQTKGVPNSVTKTPTPSPISQSSQLTPQQKVQYLTQPSQVTSQMSVDPKHVSSMQREQTRVTRISPGVQYQTIPSSSYRDVPYKELTPTPPISYLKVSSPTPAQDWVDRKSDITGQYRQYAESKGIPRASVLSTSELRKESITQFKTEEKTRQQELIELNQINKELEFRQKNLLSDVNYKNVNGQLVITSELSEKQQRELNQIQSLEAKQQERSRLLAPFLTSAMGISSLESQYQQQLAIDVNRLSTRFQAEEKFSELGFAGTNPLRDYQAETIRLQNEFADFSGQSSLTVDTKKNIYQKVEEKVGRSKTGQEWARGITELSKKNYKPNLNKPSDYLRYYGTSAGITSKALNIGLQRTPRQSQDRLKTNPLSTTLIGVGGVVGTSLVVTGGLASVGGLAVSTGLGYSTPIIAEQLSRPFLTEEQERYIGKKEYKEAINYAKGYQQSKRNKLQNFIGNVPTVDEFVGKEHFEEGVKKYYENKGYTGKALSDRIKATTVRGTTGEYVEPLPFIGNEIVSEGVGRVLFAQSAKKSVLDYTSLTGGQAFRKGFGQSVPTLSRAGFVEGSGQYLAETKLVYGDVQPGGYVGYGLLGSTTASVLGGTIVGAQARKVVSGSGGALATSTQWLGYGLDFPGEIVGDKLTDVGFAGIRRTGVRTPSPSFVKTQTEGKERIILADYQPSITVLPEYTVSTPKSTTFTQTNQKAPSYTGSFVQTTSKSTTPNNVLLPSTQNILINTQTQTNIPTLTSAQVATTTDVDVFDFVTTKTTIPSSVSTDVTSTATTTTSTTTNVPVNVPVIVPNGFGLPIIPFDYPGKKRLKKGGRKGLRSQYLPSFNAIILNIKSKKKPSKQFYSGLETRPILVN